MAYPAGGAQLAPALAVIWLAGAVACAAGILLPAQRRAAAEPVIITLGVLALSAWALWRAGVALDQRRSLLWTGERWILRAAGADMPLARVVVGVDLQRLILLRATASGRARPLWLVLTRTPATDCDWHLLRCALYAPHAASDPAR